ncbi:MAG: sigma 54-interacting transcriptional regulator [Deltaproteobacteria bacterium]|nr:sigma 54-interacting transcriptional regulator [Deltaproteobacteria bacterium]
MINWEEFEHLHVIRKLKEILSNWWNVEIFFADDRGRLRNIREAGEKEFKNRLINLVLHNEQGFQSLSQFAGEAVSAARHAESRYLMLQWLLGGSGIVFPIQIQDEFMGAVIATGFCREGMTESQKEELRNALIAMKFPAIDVGQALDRMKTVMEEEMPRFTELIELVGQEIITINNEIASREDRISELNKELGTRYRYDNMIGKSRAMQEVYVLLDKIKNSESTVLVQGDNGTGKELIARSIHFNSPRKEKAFVTQNCSAFNENLLDSELFGHVKGSFTGAVRDKKGLFEIADGGTLFLDEIGDTSPAMQVKLLRILQEGTFLPVGGTEPRHVNVRLLAATNKNLKEMVDRGEFREDLYYRINVINVNVPPLRDRKEDIPLLIDHFLDKAAQERGQRRKMITKRAMEKIYDYYWPGNIRELQNEIERLVVLAGDEEKITPEMLSSRIRDYGEKGKIQGVRLQGKLKDAIEELERQMILEGLRRTGWNKSKLAKELGISRAGLIMKVEKFNLDKRKTAKK